jgi:hypothetical protein
VAAHDHLEGRLVAVGEEERQQPAVAQAAPVGGRQGAAQALQGLLQAAGVYVRLLAHNL